MNYNLFSLLFLIMVAALRIFELFWLPRKKKKGKIYARWTLIFLSAGFGMVVIGSLSELYFSKTSINILISVVGFVLIVIRAPIKFLAAKTLGEYWSPHVEIREKQKIVKIGLYKYIRHPVYMAASFELIGIPLFLNSFYTLCTISVFLFIGILIRAKIEEKTMLMNLGDEYRIYLDETWGLFPFRKILKKLKKGVLDGKEILTKHRLADRG